MRDTLTVDLWTAGQTSIPSLHRYCYTKLIAGSDGSLNDYVNFTSHTQNRVISQQSRCPSEMGSHEYVLFGSLRSGERLQLFNLLGAFLSAEIDFNSPATALLFRYAISQVGTACFASPLYLRESQIVWEDEHFSNSLLDALENAFLKIEANFKEAAAAAILLGVALKALSLSSFAEIATRCTCSPDSPIRSRDLSHQILTVCILCRRTYGVDTEAQPSMFSDHDAVADYVEASVHLHTHRKSQSDTEGPKNETELLNDACLGRRNEKHLLVALQLNESAITDGIKRFWATAMFTDKWQLVHRDDSSWISNRASSKVVHYNLVTGSLVSGQAISQLPTEYTSSPLSHSIFGELDLDVFAADTDDMEYVSKDDFHGHRVYFGIRGNVILICSQSNDETFEAIQHDHFEQIFHEQLERPFRSDGSDWTLITAVKSESKTCMYANQKQLIDTHSQVGSIICNALRPIEQSSHIVVMFCQTTTIEIELPRYNLHFFVDFKGRIVCKELSAFVDFDQELGTLHGFQSRLILRIMSKIAGSNLRTLLIPHGDVKHNSSTSSYICSSPLVSQDLEAHLYEAYPHAITSFPKSDYLTGRTGTEESLTALSDHVCRICQLFSKCAQAILSLIAQFTLGRKFYPPHLKTMQTVTFDNVLPAMVQRDIFFGTVHEIIAHNMKADWLFDANVTAIPYKGDFGLLDRSHHRTRKLFPSESVASMSHPMNDEDYCSRDQGLDCNFRASADMADVVESSEPAFGVDTSWNSKIQTWQKSQWVQQGFYIQLLLESVRSASTSKESLMFVLSLLAFEQPAIGEQLRALLAFAISPALRDLAAPGHDSYDLRDGYTLNRKEILMLLSQCEQSFIPSETSEVDEDGIAKEQLRFQKELAAQHESILEALREAWPCDTVQLPAKQGLDHYKVLELEALLDGMFAVWHKNYLFLQLLEDYDRRLKAFSTSRTSPDISDTIVDFEHTTCFSPQDMHFSLLDLMAMTPITVVDFNESSPTGFDGDLSQLVSQQVIPTLLESNQVRSSWEDLEDIVEELSCDSSVAVREYGQFLGNSIETMQSRSGQAQPKTKVPSCETLTQKLEESRGHIAYVLARTFRFTPAPLSRASKKVPACWMPVLLQFAREITAAQRVERLQKFLDIEDAFALNNELINPAHSTWSSEKRPDWLLIECQNNFLIRPVQIQVAKELLKPENGTVLLSMGEGKTSVIPNLVVTALAQGSHLVRVIVLKPLAQEMLRLLSRSLAGLAGRTLYYLPFSRQTTPTAETPRRLMSLYQECRQTGGILLTLPEYLNSFGLMGIDKLAADTHHIAAELIRVQKWLDFNARDVLDESEELLRPAYEIVYTNGEANLLSGAPDRWNVSLEILDLIQKKAKALYTEFPKAIEVEIQRRGSFHHVRVLSEDGTAAVANLVATAIVDGQLLSLSLGHCNPDVLQAIGSFILNVDVEDAQLELVAQHFQSSAKLDLVYVARGFVSHQILSHTLRKRWKPDASIILTALSFYYTGILRPDLRRCLLILLRLPDPTDAYGKWMKHSGLPGKYRKVNSINLDDASCVDTLYDHLCYNSGLINFFLRHVVYLSEAKQFRYKLSTSAWDLCRNAGVLTKDLPELRHITASTLSTLLRHENRQYFCAASPSGQRLVTKKLLQRITADGPVDVIIDVGAQMLEGSKEIAHLWLQISPQKMATIFFSDNDEKMVLSRDGSTERLPSSIFKDELKSCLIFLDQFHTRGTDFLLPDNFAAAVLLGPGILKDNLVQACMRMRNLAVSQRVRFYAPPEVDQAIRSITKDPFGNLDSLHVVRWAINESCLARKKQDPPYITQGLLHSRRRLAADRHVSSDGKITKPEQYLDTIREQEWRPVSELYCASGPHRAELPFQPTLEESQDSVIQYLRAEFERTNVVEFENSGITQEQEREILHEVEEEREVQRPREVWPAVPQHCQRLLDFIRNGTPLTGPLSFVRASRSWSIPASDFMRTVQNKDDSPEDDFLRPVQWVVKTSEIERLIIISPHEADVFFQSIRESTWATMHMYQARTSRGVVSFDALNICKLPANTASGQITPQAVALLGPFAGQLYFSSFEHYKEFIDMRRAGIEWTHTHMGRVLNGQILRRQNFEEDEEENIVQDTEELSLDGEDETEESETAESE
ncbi:uncharacterized protein Z519_00903 [Cladophialophora bantiana CBS 173.52]|uniref:ubiquitinyl hydrolase 1 n=1 Tax=Cladophialophora bantiana (strain ATCC 10958 / CBS 173.52 / CDC B-1940 / NIH 8579) TaxID=1442370 RepID=A0A0D2I7L1_CLAB1|nr:uncharacterized protein Z519_00903 [Cladophialophora bantiana CBS 173.52]KIW99240.1 hypothetical protein Z519_00903 [Cladophialophora bantiana CBS 173.52]